MDRLIRGDVGDGKTEIAVRAAFKAVQMVSRPPSWSAMMPLVQAARTDLLLSDTRRSW